MKEEVKIEWIQALNALFAAWSTVNTLTTEASGPLMAVIKPIAAGLTIVFGLFFLILFMVSYLRHFNKI